jgi:hypothetical protein
VERVFAELAAERPDGLRYATFRLDDGVTFVHLVVSEDGADPLPRLTAFKEFTEGLAGRVAVKPVRSAADIIGSYRFLTG